MYCVQLTKFPDMGLTLRGGFWVLGGQECLRLRRWFAKEEPGDAKVKFPKYQELYTCCPGDRMNLYVRGATRLPNFQPQCLAPCKSFAL